MWTEPLITVGGASFTDWLVRAAGGVNVFGGGSSVAIVLGRNLSKRALCSCQQRRFVAPHESEREA